MPKLQAIAQARGGNDERIYVRGDKSVDYGTHDEGDGAAVGGRLPSGRLGHRIRAGLESQVRMRTASVISTGLHAAVLLWAVVSFTGETFKVTPAESLPVDLISEQEFSEMTKGIKDAPKPVETPKPLVEKKDEPKPKIEDFKAPITEKTDIKPTADKQPEPAPQPKPDPIAEKLKKTETKVTEAEPPRLPPKKPPLPKQPKFDADKIAALLDQRAPQRQAVTGQEPSCPRSAPPWAMPPSSRNPSSTRCAPG